MATVEVVDADSLIRRLRRESAAVLGMSPEEVDEADLHLLEERLNLKDRAIARPIETMGGLPESPLYLVGSPKLRSARKKALDLLLARYD